MPKSPLSLLLGRSIIFLSLLVFLFSCKEEDDTALDPDFSINIARPSSTFPPERDSMKAAEIELYEFHGKPDFIRIWWSSDGRIHRLLEVDRILKDPQKVKSFDRSWIYLEQDKEYVIKDDEHYVEKPLSDKLKALCQYGDPEDVTRLSVHAPIKENWRYYSRGLILTFVDQKLVKTQSHAPMGAFIKR